MEKILGVIKHPAMISILVLIIGVIAIVLLIRSIPEENIPSAERVERSWGKQDSKVVVEGYADLECPACKAFWQTIEKDIKAKYGDRIKFVFQHYPLSGHPKAIPAAQAAEAAGAQGKFFEYVDYLYEVQSTSEVQKWDTAKFVEYARIVGISDIDKFEKELKEKYYKKAINEYVDLGNDRNIQGTPTIFVNGKNLGSPSFETLDKEIQLQLDATSTGTASN
jgi:protein-disulfide isomerase